jgi:translation elongation factor P/translation initiation factor 5A
LGNAEKNIPGWIQDHISKAHSYIHQSNSGYHEYGTGVNEGKLQFKNLKKGDILVGKFPPYKEMEVISSTDKSAKVKSSKGGVVDIYSTNNYELKENSMKLSKFLKENTEPEIITQLRDVMKSGYKTLKDPKSGKKMKVDSYSASAIVKVYDAINQTNKDKFSKLGLLGMQNVAFKLMK